MHSSSVAGPREAPLLRGISQTRECCEPGAPLQGSGWLTQATQPDAEGFQLLEGSCRHLSPQQITKYMPRYYRHATGQTKGEDDTELEDKLQELQQQTLATHTEWQEEQAAAHTYANRKVKAGTPFTRPDLTHPKLVGAAGIVPNNMHKHKRKPVKYDCSPFTFESVRPLPTTTKFSASFGLLLKWCGSKPNSGRKKPDLTKNPSEAQVVHFPSHTGNSLLDREGVRRRPPIAKLHCKAFQFPVLVAEQDGKADRNAASRAVQHHRGYQMLGSGFRIRRDQNLQF